jgi:hypothetical protein
MASRRRAGRTRPLPTKHPFERHSRQRKVAPLSGEHKHSGLTAATLGTVLVACLLGASAWYGGWLGASASLRVERVDASRHGQRDYNQEGQLATSAHVVIRRLAFMGRMSTYAST